MATTDLDAALTPVIERAMQEMLVPGALVHVRIGGAPALHRAYGFRDLARTDPMTIQDHVRIGSNTKTMTGTVILKLVEQGLLDLDAPVSAYRQNVPNGDDISITDLLDMRSGLENYSARLDLNQQLDRDPKRAWTAEELLELGLGLPPHASPRAEFFYSNTNTVLLGLIAKERGKKQLTELYAQWIFHPLGLSQTSMPSYDTYEIPAPHPRGYMYLSNVETLGSPAIPPDQRVTAHAGTLQPGDHTEDSPSWTWAAGGVISTLDDLVTYVEALVKGGLLNDELQQRRLASLTSSNPHCDNAASYGWALAKFGPYLGHDGTLPGFQSFMGHDPVTDSTIVVATNLTFAPDGRETANAIVQAMMAALDASSAG